MLKLKAISCYADGKLKLYVLNIQILPDLYQKKRLFISAVLKVLNSSLSFLFWLSPTFLLSNLKHLNTDLNIPANCLRDCLIHSLLCSILQTLQFSYWARKGFFSQVFLWGQEQRWKDFSFHLEIPILSQDGLIITVVEKREDYFLSLYLFFFTPTLKISEWIGTGDQQGDLKWAA